jgi:hypothetical protein
MKKLKQYLITTGVGLLIVFLVFLTRDAGKLTETKDIIQVLCDAFFVAGVLITGLGLLVVMSNLGAFEMLVYGLTSFIDFFRKKSERKYETFYDYHEARAGNKSSFWFMLIVGFIFIGISLIFLMVYEAL